MANSEVRAVERVRPVEDGDEPATLTEMLDFLRESTDGAVGE
ncbi:hypothetical protein [Kribbella sancticallisti]